MNLLIELPNAATDEADMPYILRCIADELEQPDNPIAEQQELPDGSYMFLTDLGAAYLHPNYEKD